MTSHIRWTSARLSSGPNGEVAEVDSTKPAIPHMSSGPWFPVSRPSSALGLCPCLVLCFIVRSEGRNDVGKSQLQIAASGDADRRRVGHGAGLRPYGNPVDVGGRILRVEVEHADDPERRSS